MIPNCPDRLRSDRASLPGKLELDPVAAMGQLAVGGPFLPLRHEVADDRFAGRVDGASSALQGQTFRFGRPSFGVSQPKL